jgi:hypothetical protein
MTWRILWYIAGRWYEARAERLRWRILDGRCRDNPDLYAKTFARMMALRSRAEKFFLKAGL